MQRINTNLSPFVVLERPCFFINFHSLVTFCSFPLQCMCDSSVITFHLSNHSNFCQLWMCDLRKFWPLHLCQSSSISSIYNTAVCFLPPSWSSFVDFFFNPESHQQGVPNTGDLIVLPLSMPW